MTTYTKLLQITANSAIDTAHICYRKARRDCYRIHALLTHPRTVQAAKIAVWCLYLGAVIAFTLGQTARILVDTGVKAIQQWQDAEGASCLNTEAAEEPATEADPFSPAENPAYAAVPATIAAPVVSRTVKVKAKQPKANKPMTETQRLRRECAAAGIRWRNARGEGRHLTNAQMAEALGQQ